MRCLLSWTGALLCAVMSVVTNGCAICASPYDDSYAAYGGLRERTDQVHGRVGSVFDPAPEIIHERPQEQSPQLAEPPSQPAEDLPPAETPPVGPDEVRPAPENGLPDIPNGSLELPDLGPEFESDELPIPNDLPESNDMLPDVSGGDRDRSARQHPLHDLFDEEL